MHHDKSTSSRRKGKTPQRRLAPAPGPSGSAPSSPRRSGASRESELVIMVQLFFRNVPFSQLVREVCQSFSHGLLKWEVAALAALQEISEAFLVLLFSDANLCAIHARRVTNFPRDI